MCVREGVCVSICLSLSLCMCVTPSVCIYLSHCPFILNRIESGVNYFIAYAEQITNSVHLDETVFILSVITSEKAGQTRVRLMEERTESNPL